jgi:hypothetical protein
MLVLVLKLTSTGRYEDWRLVCCDQNTGCVCGRFQGHLGLRQSRKRDDEIIVSLMVRCVIGFAVRDHFFLPIARRSFGSGRDISLRSF